MELYLCRFMPGRCTHTAYQLHTVETFGIQLNIPEVGYERYLLCAIELIDTFFYEPGCRKTVTDSDLEEDIRR